MRRWSGVIGLLALLMAMATPGSAQHQSVRASIGYAFSQYLEKGGGNAPLGAYLSIASAGKTVGLEVDAAYHRDSESGIVLNTAIVGVGPRFAPTVSGNSKPFLHALGGFRLDNVADGSNLAFGGSAGIGVDLAAGSNAFVRLGADFQMFFDEGENVKTLRLTAGIAF